jgi:phytoene synthase
MISETLEDYEVLLEHLGGSIFQVFPYLTENMRHSVRAFGALDQFLNHLRDLEEDTRQNICYFPSDVLERFGVERQEVLDHSCIKNENFNKMMRFWLDDYLPYLFQKASPFLQQAEMHFSWRILRHWFLRRHARIEHALRVCNMDFRAATRLYFEEAKPNLETWLKETFLAEGCAELLSAGPDLPLWQPGARSPEKAPSSAEPEAGVGLTTPADSGLQVLARQRTIRSA